jgi:hypothetical protein
MAAVLQQIGTPLQLIALFLILVAGIARLLVRSDNSEGSPAVKRLVINRIFIVALVALVLGTLAGSVSPLVDRWISNDELFHVAVLSTNGDAIPNASVNVLTIYSGNTSPDGRIDIPVPRNRTRNEYEIQVKAPGYETPGLLTKTGAEMRNLAVRLTPAPQDLVKAMTTDFIIGQYFGQPMVLATFRVENPGTSTVNITEMRATVTGSKGTFVVTPFAWTIANPYGPFAAAPGFFPIFAGAKLDLRVVMGTGANFAPLYSKTATLPEYKTQMPCGVKSNGSLEPMTNAAFQIAKEFSEDHFAWYPGDWKFSVDVSTDSEHKSFTREFSLSAADVDRLKGSIVLLKQCLSINMTSPLAQDGTLSNFLRK